MSGNYKILVIDDQEIIFMMIKKTLSSIGITDIEYAPNGTQGIEMDAAKDYDVITCDFNMPGLSGLETVAKILEIHPQKKIIMLTAMGQEAIVKEAISLGVTNYILKPFTPDKLLRTIAEALKK